MSVSPETTKALENSSAEARLDWAVDTFGESLLFTSSFGPGSGALLALWADRARALPVHFIDTGFLFEETLVYRDQVARLLGLTVVVLRPSVPKKKFLKQYGPTVYRDDSDLCCSINKVAPLDEALKLKTAWVSGLRRDQGPSRKDTPVVQVTEGPVKVFPVVDWSAERVRSFAESHGVPEHPLAARGYRSVGCEPCTRPTLPSEPERAGRWAESEKTECGIHTFLKVR